MKNAIAFSICLIASIAFATHNRGGEILYKRIAPTTTLVNGVATDYFNYRITVKKYSDHGGGAADRCVDTVYFGDGTRGVALRVNGPNTCSLNCGSAARCGSVVISQPGYLVNESIYEIDHVYPGPGNYVITNTDPFRNQGVVNIPNSINQVFHIRSMLVIGTGTNSSPVSANYPLGVGDNVNCFYHNPQATDAEGDSLSYELWASEGLNGTVPGFTFPATGPGGYFFITSAGLLHWCWPQTIGEYNFAIMIREWRKNTTGVYVQNGYVFRENQVIIRVGVLGLNNPEVDSALSAFPNPFDNSLEVTAMEGKAGQVIVYAADGRAVLSAEKQAGESLRLNTSGLAPGMYLLKLEQESGSIYKKVMKSQ